MPAMVALILGIIFLTVVPNGTVTLVAFAIGIALAVFVYLAAGRLIGQGR